MPPGFAARRLIEQERLRELREHEKAEREVNAARARIRAVLESSFLDAEQKIDPADLALIAPEGLAETRTHFVRDWARSEMQIDLDPDQARAVAGYPVDLLVTARAGSGKTRMLVTRAVFLQKHCQLRPNELLLLAFNRKAAEEMRERLADALDDQVPHVMTFHALAHAIVHPEQGLVFDDRSTDQLGLSREVQHVIDAHRRHDEDERGLVRELMLRHYREDWERIVAGGFHLPLEEVRNHRRNLPRETIAGEWVKSFGEKLIANALFEYDVAYTYERSVPWNGTNYQPDFTIDTGPTAGIVIEYFGLAGDSRYDESSSAKRRYWSQREGWTLLEFTPKDITSRGADDFVTYLLERLSALGISPRRLSDEDVWSRVQHRAIDDFTKLMTTFVGRCRSRGWDPAELRDRIDHHAPASHSEELFLSIGADVLERYIARLNEEHNEDFNGLVWRATNAINAGQTKFSRDGGQERGDVSLGCRLSGTGPVCSGRS